MKKFVLALFTVALSVFMLASCSPSSETLDDLHQTVEKACAAADFSNLEFNFKSDDYSEEILMYMYGVEDEDLIDSIEDFVLSERSGMSASTFSVIRFKSGTEKSVIDSVKTAVEEVYVQSLMNALMPYDPTEYEISKEYKFKTIGNDLVLVISKDADAVLEAVVK
ncbi:MAG: DUF4358 domain-containing protein [Clostridia bacterium]|nr:DUF4358 domain-containing protein [Clostridia bacterium]